MTKQVFESTTVISELSLISSYSPINKLSYLFTESLANIARAANKEEARLDWTTIQIHSEPGAKPVKGEPEFITTEDYVPTTAIDTISALVLRVRVTGETLVSGL